MGAVSGKQHTVYRLIGGVPLFHDKLAQGRTAREDRGTQAGNRRGQGKCGKATVDEGRIVDIGNPLGQHHSFQQGVSAKHTAGDGLHAGRQLGIGQLIAVGKGVGFHGGHAVGQGDGGQGDALRESAEFNDPQVGGQGDGLQVAQIIEAILPDSDQAFGQHHLGTVGAPVKSTFANLGNSLGNHDLPHAFPILIPGGVGEAVAGDSAGAGHGQGTRIPVQHPGQVAVDPAGGGHVAHIGSQGHGILGVELGGFEFRVPIVLGEVCLRAQELAVMSHQIPIPGGVGIVIQAVQVDDIPGMALGARDVGADTRDVAAVHTQLQHQTVIQAGKALTDGVMLDQRRVGGVLIVADVILKIVPIVVIVHVFGDPVVNSLDLIVVGGVPKVQLAQQRGYGGIHLGLHLGGADKAAIDGDEGVDPVGIGKGLGVVGVSADHVRADIVTLFTNARVLHGLFDSTNQIITRQRQAVDADLNVRVARHHLSADGKDELLYAVDTGDGLFGTALGAEAVGVGVGIFVNSNTN